MAAKYKSIYQPGHILLPAGQHSMPLHRKILFEKIGYGPHWCTWCSRALQWQHPDLFQAVYTDHLNSDSLDNTPENLVESCNVCNLVRHRLDLTECRRGHPFDEENTRYVAKADGSVARRCVTCTRVSNLRAEAKRAQRK